MSTGAQKVNENGVDSGVELKASCSSPLAFTVNFDEDTNEEEDRRNNNNNNHNNHSSQSNVSGRKALNLQDGFNRFSPKHRLSSSSSKSTVRRDSMGPSESRKTPGEEDDGSDTGTYTIEDEDEESKGSWNEDLSTSRDEDWISRWAEEQALQQQKIRQEQKRRNNTPPSESSFRRRLPRLPSSSNHSNESTEDLLKDTLSVVNAMEARIEESSSSVVLEKRKPSQAKGTSSSSLKNERILKKVDPREAAKLSELEAWKRRKNYRPIPSSRLPTKSNRLLSSSASESGRIITRDDLRQQITAKGGPSKPKATGKPKANNARSTSSMSSKDAEFQAWKRRKNYNPLQAVANSKKKNGSLSHLMNEESSIAGSTVTAVSRRGEPLGESERTLHSLQALKVSGSSSSLMPPRSASFHYPSQGVPGTFTSDEDYEEESMGYGEEEEDNSSKGLQQIGSKSFSARKTPQGGEGSLRMAPGGVKPLSTKGHQKLEALDNLVISTIFSVSTKLCISSQNLLQKVRTSDLELSSIIDTLLYVLDDTDPPVSPSKKTSRELSGTLRNLKKVEQVLQVLERFHCDED